MEILKEAWDVVRNASVLALFMIYFHIPQRVENYIQNSQNMQEARELLHMVEKQKAAINADKLDQIQIKGGDVV